MNIDLSKAPAGAERYFHNRSGIIWLKKYRGEHYWSGDHDNWLAYGYGCRELAGRQWEAAIPIYKDLPSTPEEDEAFNALGEQTGNDNQPTQWLGPQDGLPPEGTECEVELQSNVWEWCKIKATRGSGSWITTSTEDRVIRNDLVRFRPIQSDRDKGIDEAMSHIRQDWYAEPSVSISEFVTNAVAQLYDAGYRKPMSLADGVNILRKFCPGLPESSSKIILNALGYKE